MTRGLRVSSELSDLDPDLEKAVLSSSSSMSSMISTALLFLRGLALFAGWTSGLRTSALDRKTRVTTWLSLTSVVLVENL